MQILIGDEFGLVKEFEVEKGNNRRSGLRLASATHLAKPDNTKAIRRVALRTSSIPANGDRDFFIACQDGSLHRGTSYRNRRSKVVGESDKTTAKSASSSSSSCSMMELVFETDEDKAASPRGLSIINRKGGDDDDDDGLPTILTCDANGLIRILDSTANEASALRVSSSFKIAPPNPKNVVKVENMRLNHLQTRVCVTGKDQDLLMCDLETGALAFVSKNVPHDHLDRALPIWGTDLDFMDESGNTVAVCTAHDRVRLYDVRASPRRPVVDLDLQPTSPGIRARHLNALVSLGDGRDVVTADNFGNVSRVSLVAVGGGGDDGGGGGRKGMVAGAALVSREVGKYQGATGSVSALALDSSSRRLVSGGLDRYVRVYDVDSRELLVEAFCKQRTTALCCIGEGDGAIRAAEEEEKDDDAWFDFGGEEEEEEEEEEREQQQRNKRGKHETFSADSTSATRHQPNKKGRAAR